MSRFVLPLALFAAIAATLALGLRHQADGGDPAVLPSPLVGRDVPAFTAPILTSARADVGTFRPADLRGQVWLLNVWASWCTSCLREHPVLLDRAKAGGVPLVGLNYQDEADRARAWLSRHGNPYLVTVSDADGRVGIEFGVVAVPETFVIDKRGRIRHKFTGPLSEADWQQTLLPLIRELQRA
ncbi:DsbE family thiol:disulfide interchange protein [uncultured Aquabacterium sp.]|uniref:DsbE family thiol:disulfide interchange protein n=1 Tax=Aquabacterium sp. TaxID=1872578 RepID=UPI0025E8391C|nr:DsbE family thiol:disulfide interchange protein [uncultured Aquabacterium sp.]